MKKLISILVFGSLCLALGACSSSKTSDDDLMSDEIPSADAGTDSVPADAAEMSSSSTPDAAESDSATPPADQTASADASGTGASPDTSTPPPIDPALAQASPSDQTIPPAPAADAPVSDPSIDSASATTTPDSSLDSSLNSSTTSASETTDSSLSSTASTDGESYTVHRGDTLMKIAFETYGDLYKWRQIYEANRDKLSDPNVIPTGTVLTIRRASDSPTPSRNGEKYLVRNGDTLGTISNDVYGTPTKWKKIWQNNRELIKDPNRIFAGFYLYYTMSPEDQRQLEQLRGNPAIGQQEQQQPEQQPTAESVSAPTTESPTAAAAPAEQQQAPAPDVRTPAAATAAALGN